MAGFFSEVRKAVGDAVRPNWRTDDLDAVGAIPNTYDYARNPDYFRKNKDIDFEMVDMSPDEYIQEASRALGADPDEVVRQRSQNRENIDFLRGAMESGESIQPGFIDYRQGGQEGFHRALAAKELGQETIPVGVIRSAKGENAVAPPGAKTQRVEVTENVDPRFDPRVKEQERIAGLTTEVESRGTQDVRTSP